jgi:hypothetical protein
MGGSGEGYFSSETPENVRDALRKEEKATENQIFETQVSKDIGDLLGEYNNRDADGVREALEKLKKALENDVEDGAITPVFGGSVRKHTYVDGISDIDSLFVLKGKELAGLQPHEALDLFESRVRTVFAGAKPERDAMSLRIPYRGLVLEILPAVRREGQLCVASESGKSWSKINPQSFLRKLTEVNDKYGGKLVPAIKIAKGINEKFPEGQRLSGYHLESLAIEAFRDYRGPQNTKAMVEHLIESAAEHVLKPIRDKTGQSLHVDEYAGAKGSETRRLIAQNLQRVSRRMKNANANRSREKWAELLSQPQ